MIIFLCRILHKKESEFILKKIFPPTTKRICISTNQNVNYKIRNHTIRNINVYKNSSDKILSDNIEKLNSEWDIERIIELRAASLVIASTILGLKKNKNWFFLTGAAGAFLLQHSLQGWCPSLPILRRMGVRTAEEINNEKMVYKMLRKDFPNIDSNDDLDAEEMLNIVEK